jgi:UDP-N-acetylmuramoyl-tripeptide--D-alanyl-D-alanine ligase
VATPIPANRARFTIEEIVRATRGTIARKGSEAREPVGIVSDSRAVATGSVFLAIKGESHDGHAFVSAAAKREPAVIVVERGRTPAPVPGDDTTTTYVEVDDTLVALGDLARVHLEAWRASGPDKKVLSITGSAGKTTTKELAAALFAAVAPTHRTAGNLNNRVGVPFVVLGLLPEHRFAVLEMGMSLPGELDAITTFARPDVSIITNVGLAHSEGVGGPEGVMREKGAVYRALEPSGVAVANADDERVMRASTTTRAKTILTYGLSDEAQYRLVARKPSGSGSDLTLATPTRTLTVHLPLPGEAAAIDLAAALAAQEAATGVELSPAAIDAALATVTLSGRATVAQLGSGITVLDDTYNANPASMRSALSTLSEIAQGRRKVAILGEMKELGAHAEPEHDALGDILADSGVALAIGCGGLISRALKRAGARGIACVMAGSTEEAAREATARVLPNDAVLVKGSRSVGAERVVAALIETWPLPGNSATSSSG